MPATHSAAPSPQSAACSGLRTEMVAMVAHSAGSSSAAPKWLWSIGLLVVSPMNSACPVMAYIAIA